MSRFYVGQGVADTRFPSRITRKIFDFDGVLAYDTKISLWILKWLVLPFSNYPRIFAKFNALRTHFMVPEGYDLPRPPCVSTSGDYIIVTSRLIYDKPSIRRFCRRWYGREPSQIFARANLSYTEPQFKELTLGLFCAFDTGEGFLYHEDKKEVMDYLKQKEIINDYHSY